MWEQPDTSLSLQFANNTLVFCDATKDHVSNINAVSKWIVVKSKQKSIFPKTELIRGA